MRRFQRSAFLPREKVAVFIKHRAGSLMNYTRDYANVGNPEIERQVGSRVDLLPAPWNGLLFAAFTITSHSTLKIDALLK